MMRSLWTAASGMRAQQVNVDTISNNIANINTIGYKSEQASFKSLLYQNLQSTSTNNAGDEKPVAAEVGLGSRVAAITSQFTQGELLMSDNPLNFALEGDGFFQVRNAQGELFYTRDGGFSLSPRDDGNLLCNTDGYPVLDTNGGVILFPKEIPLTNIQVSDTGAISYLDYNEDGKTYTSVSLNQTFGIYQFNNPAGLYRMGNNNYGVTVASGEPVAEFGNDVVKHTKVRQKYTEGSNVDVANEIVNLIIAQRAYEMNSKAIQTTDDMMQKANNLRS